MVTDRARDKNTESRQHRPEAVRVQSRCRVDCSCGWRGPLVSMFGEGHKPWSEHFKEVAR